MAPRKPGPVKDSRVLPSIEVNGRSNKDFSHTWKHLADAARSLIEEIELIFYTLWQWILTLWSDLFFSREKHAVRQWMRAHVQDIPEDFTESWKNGIVFCSLLESLMPGCCPRPDLLDVNHSSKNVRKALGILEKFFGIVPDITAEEIVNCSRGSEKKLVAILRELQKKSESAGNGTHPYERKENDALLPCESEVQPCFAKGIGLVVGFVGRIARFSLFFNSSSDLDIVVEIKGPQNTMCCERITSRSPKRKKSSIKSSHRPRLSRIGRSMSMHEGLLTETSEKDKHDEEEIRLEYEIQADKAMIGYIPPKTGQYRVTILWHGQHISGSPFSVGIEDTFEKFSDGSLVHLKPTLRYKDGGESICKKRTSKSKKQPVRFKGDIDPKQCLKVTKRKTLRYIVKVGGKEVVVDADSSDMLAPALLKLDYELNDGYLASRRNSWGFTGDVERKRSTVRQFCVNPDDVESYALHRRSSFSLGCNNEGKRLLKPSKGDENCQQSGGLITVTEGTDKDFHLDTGLQNFDTNQNFENAYTREEETECSERCDRTHASLCGDAVPLRSVENSPESRNAGETRDNPQNKQQDATVVSDSPYFIAQLEDSLRSSQIDTHDIISENELQEKGKKKLEQTIPDMPLRQFTESKTSGEMAYNDTTAGRHTADKKTTIPSVHSLVCSRNKFPLSGSTRKRAYRKIRHLSLEEEKCQVARSTRPPEKRADVTSREILRAKRRHAVTKHKDFRKLHSSDFSTARPLKTRSNTLQGVDSGLSEARVKTDEETVSRTTTEQRSETPLHFQSSFGAEMGNADDKLCDARFQFSAGILGSEQCSAFGENSFHDAVNKNSLPAECLHVSNRSEEPRSREERSDNKPRLIRQSATEQPDFAKDGSTAVHSLQANKPLFTFQSYKERGMSFVGLSFSPSVKELVKDLEKRLLCSEDAAKENNLYSRSLNFPPLAVNVDRKNVKTRIRQWETTSSLPSSALRSKDSFDRSPEKGKLSVLSDVQTKTVFWENVYKKSSSDSRITKNASQNYESEMKYKLFGPKKITRSQDFSDAVNLLESADGGSEQCTVNHVDRKLLDWHALISTQEAGRHDAPQRRLRRYSDPGPVFLDPGDYDGIPVISRTTSTSTIEGLSSAAFLSPSHADGNSSRDEYIDDEIPDYAAMFLDNYAENAGPLFHLRHSSSRPNADECRVFGSGVYYGHVSAKNHFQVLTKGAGKGNLSVSVMGSSAHDVTYVSVTYIRKDIYDVTYQVLEPGYYLISVRWSDVPVPGSPFVCKVTY